MMLLFNVVTSEWDVLKICDPAGLCFVFYFILSMFWLFGQISSTRKHITEFLFKINTKLNYSRNAVYEMSCDAISKFC